MVGAPGVLSSVGHLLADSPQTGASTPPLPELHYAEYISTSSWQHLKDRIRNPSKAGYFCTAFQVRLFCHSRGLTRRGPRRTDASLPFWKAEVHGLEGNKRLPWSSSQFVVLWLLDLQGDFKIRLYLLCVLDMNSGEGVKHIGFCYYSLAEAMPVGPNRSPILWWWTLSFRSCLSLVLGTLHWHVAIYRFSCVDWSEISNVTLYTQQGSAECGFSFSFPIHSPPSSFLLLALLFNFNFNFLASLRVNFFYKRVLLLEVKFEVFLIILFS